MAKYKNISGITLTLPEIGIVEADGVVEADSLNNANFQLVAESEPKKEKIKPKEEE